MSSPRKSGVSINLKDNVTIGSKCKFKINFFIAGPDKEVDFTVIAKITNTIHKEFCDFFQVLNV